MSDVYILSVSLHQQNGGMSLQAFADKEGISKRQMLSMVKRGLVMGAQRDSRSKKWCIYPPAKLLQQPRSCKKRSESVACQPVEKPAAGAQATPAEGGNFPRAALGSVEVVDFGTSPHGLSVDLSLPVQETREALSLPFPAKPVLTSGVAALPVAARTQEHGMPASCGKKPMVYTSSEVQSVRRILHEVAARQYRQGIHYLRLEGRELSQLYAALDHERSRIRKLIGKGLVDVGNLRASDSVWQKMQAMCQQGRLL